MDFGYHPKFFLSYCKYLQWKSPVISNCKIFQGKSFQMQKSPKISKCKILQIQKSPDAKISKCDFLESTHLKHTILHLHLSQTNIMQSIGDFRIEDTIWRYVPFEIMCWWSLYWEKLDFAWKPKPVRTHICEQTNHSFYLLLCNELNGKQAVLQVV